MYKSLTLSENPNTFYTTFSHSRTNEWWVSVIFVHLFVLQCFVFFSLSDSLYSQFIFFFFIFLLRLPDHLAVSASLDLGPPPDPTWCHILPEYMYNCTQNKLFVFYLLLSRCQIKQRWFMHVLHDPWNVLEHARYLQPWQYQLVFGCISNKYGLRQICRSIYLSYILTCVK